MTKYFTKFICLIVSFLLVSCTSESNNSPIDNPDFIQYPPPQGSTDGTGSFSPSSANSTVPDFILEEVSYFPTGGPIACFTANEPEVQDMPENVEWFQLFTVITCGWSDGEEVDVTLIDPTGNSVTEKNFAHRGSMDLSPGIMYFITPSTVGNYQFIFEGESTSLNIEIPVYKPISPRMYVLEDNNRIFFYSLAANERVTLLAYSMDSTAGTIKFVGWEDFYADADGILVIDTQSIDLLYFAVGEESGYLEPAYTNLHLDGSIWR